MGRMGLASIQKKSVIIVAFGSVGGRGVELGEGVVLLHDAFRAFMAFRVPLSDSLSLSLPLPSSTSV